MLDFQSYQHVLFNPRAILSNFNLDIGLNLRVPRNGLSFPFLERFGLPMPEKFTVDLAQWSNQRFRIDIASDLVLPVLPNMADLINFSAQRLIIISEPWFCQVEARINFWEMELDAIILFTDSWQQAEFSFEGELSIVPGNVQSLWRKCISIHRPRH